MKIQISDQEFHTILAALRFFQIQRDREIQNFLDIATNGYTIGRLDDEGIDALCERINTGGTGCQRCGCDLEKGLCTDETCPFSDHPQNDARGWAGHPDEKEMIKGDDGGK